MIAIVDYGVGNLFSLKSSLEYMGMETVVTADPEQIRAADRILLPGVGAFGDAVQKLQSCGLPDLLREQAEKKPLLGICLGMQLLFTRSFEYGTHEGLNLIKGEVKPLSDFLPDTLDIPHMGWNALDFPKDKLKSPIFKKLKKGEFVYFVHSYAAFGCEDAITATAEYGISVCAAVQKGFVYGTQFHPEKSGETGLKILKAFSAIPVR